MDPVHFFKLHYTSFTPARKAAAALWMHSATVLLCTERKFLQRYTINVVMCVRLKNLKCIKKPTQDLCM